MNRVEELRAEFDLAFAEPAARNDAELVDLLAIRVGTGAYAARLAEVSGVYAQKKIVALPARVPELLGVVGLREGIVPVYSLRSLLGYAREEQPSRWILVAGKAEPVALCFDALEGYVRVPKSELAATVRINEELFAVLSMSSLIASIKERIKEG